MATYTYHKLAYTYSDGVRTIFRAGGVPGILCSPRKTLPKMEEYDSVECFMMRVSASGVESGPFTLGTIVNDPAIDKKFSYKFSFDQKVVIELVDDARLKELSDIISPNRKVVCEDRELLTVDGPDLILQEDKILSNVCWCRACNDPNPYGEPDNIVPDGKFTCWSCGTHPYRVNKGCVTEDQINKVRELFIKK